MKKLHVIALLIVLGMAQRAGAQNYTQQVTAIQYFYNTDPGVGVAGNGAIISISPASSINQAFAFTVPPSLSNGINFLYVRAKDEFGKWSIAERKALFVFTPQATQDISAIQYYFDTDPGVGIAGNGAVQTITPASSISPSMGIVVPNSLSTGIHFLYIRVKDVNKSWSLVERKPFFIQQVQGTQQVTAMEYYYDTDPGCGNGNVIPITPAASVAAIFPLGVPCLSTGTHYMYVRAKDESGRWSLIERDTITVNSGIAAAVVSPAGPVAICSNSSVTLSFTPSPGVSYQWLLNGNNIAGATGSSYVVTAAGNYSLKSTCGSSFITSNVVTVTTLTLLTYYADGDGDGYGNLSVTTQACTQPSGYVLNSTDCNDSNMNIHPGASETCNLIDDDCDGLTDEGVQLTFYADADNDGYGNPSLSQVACTAPTGFVANDDDCDDANMNVHPNATEICNQIDDDCDGSIDESLVGNGIVGHWEFDGNGDDQSSGNFDLALSGSPSFSQGKYGQAMDLDGTGNK
ncbi:MAG TPA: putative metal-binding motif-containing protein, partial [Saprospiraceae bacterium]|nr:putative metal-binding motif-containing protein [Saprospiraceae bacterium]